MARTARITARVTPEQRALIATGAALSGQSISAFLRTAALERAERLIARRDNRAKIDARLATATRHPPAQPIACSLQTASGRTDPSRDTESYQDLCRRMSFSP